MLTKINDDDNLTYFKIDQSQPLREELEKAVQAWNGDEFYLEEYKELATGWLNDVPEGTRSFVITMAHETEKRHPCRHDGLALLYTDRCVILTIEELARLKQGQGDTENLLWRLTRNNRPALPPISPEHAMFARWLDAPEPCSRLYPSVCNGQAMIRMKLPVEEYPLCKACMKAMKEQMDRILENE